MGAASELDKPLFRNEKKNSCSLDGIQRRLISDIESFEKQDMTDSLTDLCCLGHVASVNAP